ncbi:isoleucyl-tRNA synthetase [Barrientosiimonas humi]|uniref:Isoleucine--tRNA ligase n=1 Tax=Barrientosiimonas humi TaxID=999931 RepID=A0A542X9X1_9MICO|nr:isoleucine--tRNA ligase [Barrientosiimonas humi]TQL32635.1 isoleucyl-tRNA synthetase [Barrientosiimonas humi]CAG7572626.1 Isoleucine--tRNA ligase [Barrientosiimonas humi]
MPYPQVDTSAGDERAHGVPQTPDLPRIEQGVLDYWDRDDTFRASVEQRAAGTDGDNEFVFYDGPPFANGLPHYGHLLTGYVKDLIPRYMTMRGKRVERRFGWDTHGLPAELEAMRQLGLKTKDEILEMGVDRFNAAARESVLRYTQEWEAYVRRMGRWVDFENDYKTLNPDFMESVLWVFKSLYDKGLVYEGFRVLPYCWNDETPLSNHELRMDEDVYQMRQDPAVTVGLRATDGDLAGALLLIWTTTPWTLPSNLAIVVGPDIDYVVVESDLPTGTTERYVLAESRVPAYARELFGDPKADWSGRVVKRLKGAELMGTHYDPPFSYYAGRENAFRVVDGDFVTTTDGTGLVHTAGAFGEDDLVVTNREGIEAVMPVGPDGRFTEPVVEYEGMQVFDANLHIIDHLKAATKGEPAGSVTPGTVLLKRESYDHSYPHCWRCRNPLIYKGVSSWFVAVTRIKDAMLRTNQEITWVPDNVKEGQFGRWLENARDWSITRNRFWGSPVPVWVSDDPAFPRVDVYGSFAELERDFGRLPRGEDGEPNLHRPYVDELTRPNPDDPSGKATMRRVEDVLDVWFDSGSMPYGQVHYPFENADWFEHHFPADFIVEYIGQTRGWFYTLHVLAAALFDKPAFGSVICHGIVLGSDGQKMSKSLRNYPDVSEVFQRDGADAMRWFLMQSPILRGGNLAVTEEGIRQGVRQVVIPLWSSWYFFSLYANAEGYEANWSTRSTDPLDRYVLAKLRDLVVDVEGRLDRYDIAGACDSVQGFVEVLTNWYIRRSRERFWSTGGDGAAEGAFDTLYTVLEVLSRVAAPLLPFTTEQIWRGLTGARSVHLTDWPDATDLPADAELVAAMDQVRAVCSATLALRKAERLRVRLPLADLTVVTTDPVALQPFSDLIADEVNVRQVRLLDVNDPDADEFGVQQRLTVNARAAGPRLGKDVQQAIKGSKSGDWAVDAEGVVTSGGLTLEPGEFTLETVVGEQASAGRAVQMLPGGGFVVLDTRVTEELAREGLARDIVRAVQDARRGAGLSVGDRISLSLVGDDEVWQAAVTHQALIMTETLAVQFGAGGEGHQLEGVTTALGDGRKVTIAISKVGS